MPGFGMNSAIYEGEVWHRRLLPRPHELRYKVAMPYVDLSELDQVLAMHPAWSERRGAPMRWRAEDYLSGPSGRASGGSAGLAERARSRVVQLCGRRPEGPVLLLANWRSFGWSFNPLSLYYCFDGAGGLAAVLGEVTNTPWGERHSYLFGEQGRAEHTVAKEMHVSPFCGMDQAYRVVAEPPGAALRVTVDVEEGGAPVILTELSLRRRELSRASMSSMLARHPAMALRVSAGIYRQAAALWAKGVPYHPHPVCPLGAGGAVAGGGKVGAGGAVEAGEAVGAGVGVGSQR